jgi:hypothetical protein
MLHLDETWDIKPHQLPECLRELERAQHTWIGKSSSGDIAWIRGYKREMG